MLRLLVNDTKIAPHPVYEEPDEAFSLSLSLTHSRQHILLYGESQSTKFVMTAPAANPAGGFYFRLPAVPSIVRLLSGRSPANVGHLSRQYLWPSDLAGQYAAFFNIKAHC